MTDPLTPPKPKDPLVKTRAGHVPPGLRSRAAKAMAVRATQGRFVLQVCVDCAQATYPTARPLPEMLGRTAVAGSAPRRRDRGRNYHPRHG